MTFALTDGLRASELAARLGCTDQTVMNYTKQGMPVAGTDGKGRFYREDECRAWIAQHKPGFKGDFGPGGKRSGAGRKGEKDDPGEAERKAIQEEVSKSGVAMFGQAAVQRAILHDLSLGMGPIELTLRYSIGASFASSLVEMYKVQKADLDMRLRKGELLEKVDVEAAWTDTLLKVNEAMTGIAPGVAAALAAELGLDARGQDLVRVKVELAVERARGLLRA